MLHKSRVLVVDDEEAIRELIVFHLEQQGYQVIEAVDGLDALKKVKDKRPELILLDLMLPGMDGLEVCRKLRGSKDFSAIPIIMLTARGEEVDRILGLEMGADDYVTKPFSPRELVARVKALLRRASQVQSFNTEQLAIGVLDIDLTRHQATFEGEALELTPKEFELLYLMAQQPGKVLTRDVLLEKVWGYEYMGDTRTVDVHIRRLRKKMEEINPDYDYIETVRGVGYRFREIRK